jgi:hypothetical protein
MQVTFPVFILAKDDLSMDMVTEPKDLNWYEKPDINDGLYEGWDVNGYLLKISWDKRLGPIVTVCNNEPQIEKLQEAIYDYAKRYNAQESFVYSGPSNDVVALFKAVEAHVRKE